MKNKVEINEDTIHSVAEGLISGIEMCIKMLSNVKESVDEGKYDGFIAHKLIDMIFDNDEQEVTKTVVEVCSYCGREVKMLWNVELDGYEIHCPYCGKTLMLCDECLHDKKENVIDKCNFHDGTCYRRNETEFIGYDGNQT